MKENTATDLVSIEEVVLEAFYKNMETTSIFLQILQNIVNNKSTNQSFNHYYSCDSDRQESFSHEEERNDSSKTPIGIEPHNIWKDKRKKDLVDAMKRYIDQNIEIPVEWLKELGDFYNNN